MKTLLTAAVIAAAPLGAVAAPDGCTIISDSAANIMRSRQNNVLMSRVVKSIKDSDQPKPLKAYYIYLTSQAYAQPRFSGKGSRDDVVRDFANRVYRACLRDRINHQANTADPASRGGGSAL